MAVDKLVDSALLDASCAYEAGKIRAKLGSAAQIAYDLANGKGFGDAIEAIPTGGGGDSRLLHLESFIPTERYYNGNYLYKQLEPSNNCAIAVYPSEKPEADETYAQALVWGQLFVNRVNMSFSLGAGYILRTTGVQGTDGNQCTFNWSTGVLRLGSNYTSFLPGVEYYIIQVDMEVSE